MVAVPSRDWSVYRELASTVEAVIHCSKQEAFVTQDLETALKKFRPDFVSLLQNPVSAERCRLIMHQHIGVSAGIVSIGRMPGRVVKKFEVRL